MTRPPKPPTDRDVELLRALAGGATDKGAAKLLGVAYETVLVDIARLHRRAGTNTRASLMWAAVENKWLEPTWAREARRERETQAFLTESARQFLPAEWIEDGAI